MPHSHAIFAQKKQQHTWIIYAYQIRSFVSMPVFCVAKINSLNSFAIYINELDAVTRAIQVPGKTEKVRMA